MKIRFFNNSLNLIGFNEDESAYIDQLSIKLRDDLIVWLSEVHNQKFYKDKTISNSFTWEGMSTWWMGRLVQKNSFTGDLWLNQLIVLHIIKYLSIKKQISLETNDLTLYESVLSNKEDFNVNIRLVQDPSILRFKNNQFLYNLKKITFSLVRELQTYILLLTVREKDTSKLDKSENIWFRTLFPINWIGDEPKNDRLFYNAPLLDKSYGYHSRYLAYISRSKKDFDLSFFRILKKIKKFQLDAQRSVFFPEKLLSLKDIYYAYKSSFKENKLFREMSNQKNFKSLFKINGLDISAILIREWSSIYLGVQQQSKLQAIATSRFFKILPDGQKIVTYGEFFAANRATYYLTKQVKPETQFITIQHAMNAKNKMFTYNHKNDFNFEGKSYGKEFSPYPDYFLVQGNQYKRILEEFYENKRISTIGSLKPINTYIKKDSKVNNRRLLLAPSIGEEYKIIFSFINNWSYLDDWEIICTPHPTLDIEKIKEYQLTTTKGLNIKYVTDCSTYELLKTVNILMTSSSTIALEAAIFNTRSVRVYELGSLPQFDKDDRIPSFYSKEDFKKWFKAENLNNFKVNYFDEISRDYFFKNDSNAGNRLWENISKII